MEKLKYIFLIISLLFVTFCDSEPESYCYKTGKVIEVKYAPQFCCHKYQMWVIKYEDGSFDRNIRYGDYYQKLHLEYINKIIYTRIDCPNK